MSHWTYKITDGLLLVVIHKCTSCDYIFYANYLWDIKDDAINRIEAIKRPTPVKPVPVDPSKKVKAIRVKEAYRQVVFPLKTLKSEEDIDKYVEQARRTLKNMLDDNDQIELK